jgi:hypothetical protein
MISCKATIAFYFTPLERPHLNRARLSRHRPSKLTGFSDREREATMGVGWLGPLKELFLIRSNLYRILLGLGCQLLGRKYCPVHPFLMTCSSYTEWSGANSITIYAPQFFKILGTTGQSEQLFATAM